MIIGAPFAAGWGRQYAGVDKEQWLAGPKRVRQQSIRYGTYVQDFDIDLTEVLNIVDYGDAEIAPEASVVATVSNILAAQAAVEKKVGEVIDAGAVPIVIGQNSPCGSYAIGKAIAERASGKVGVVSLDTHWDAAPLDRGSMDPLIAGAASWKRKLYVWHSNLSIPHLICQSAFKFDPVSASNFDPFGRRVLAVALASSELAGIAETWRARVV